MENENQELTEVSRVVKQRKNVEESLTQITAPIIDHISLIVEAGRSNEELTHIQNELRRLSRAIKKIKSKNQ
jgi:flagellar biosynthesis chaperone FliJ